MAAMCTTPLPIGSMCRRHLHGEHGVMHVLDTLDRAFDGSAARFHLFGLKSQAIAVAAQHPRVASADSQAYGVAARQNARKARTAKSDAVVADVMTAWYREQMSQIARPLPSPFGRSCAPARSHPAECPIEARIAAAREELRSLHERGEIEWSDLDPIRAYEAAFLD